MKKTDCVVLCGGINNVSLYDGYRPSYKALLRFGRRTARKTSIEYVLDALSSAGCIGRVLVIGPADKMGFLRKSYDITIKETTGSLTGDIMLGLQTFQKDGRVLFCTPDIPLVKSPAFDEFIRECDCVSSDVCMSIVQKKDCTYKVKKHFIPLKAGAYAHGNLVMVSTGISEERLGKMEELYSARKQGLFIARVLGIRFLLEFILMGVVLRIASVEGLAQKASVRLGVSLAPVFSRHAEIALDIDEPYDYEFVRGILG